MIFYSVVAYLFAFILLCYSLFNIKKNSITTSMIFILSALIYITTATMSFLIDEKYEWILVLVLIFDSLVDLVVFYLNKDKTK